MKLFTAFLAVFAAACSALPDAALFRPYRIDVRQGNFVTQEMVAQLKPGQTKDQVRFILGSPLIQDVFHAQRWDYVYRLTTGSGNVAERKLAVFFNGNILDRVSGDIAAGSKGEGDTQNKSRLIEIAPRAAAT